MKNIYFMESKSFFGKLSSGANEIGVHFSVRVEISGKAIISIDKFPLDASTRFIYDGFNKIKTRFHTLKLNGTSIGDGTQFECDNLLFTRLNYENENGMGTLRPVARYSSLNIIIPSKEITLPTLFFRIKGFNSCQHLSSENDLGLLEMVGARDADGKDEISGYIRISALNYPEDLEEWHLLANKLCFHVLQIMSFAQNVDLGFPIVEFRNKKSIEVKVFSEGEQKKSVWPTFSCLDLKDIFVCAVKSYSKQGIENLYNSITWFNMNFSYNEANFISSMTVLENIIDSNLTEEDKSFLSKESYESLRKDLSSAVKIKLNHWIKDKEERGRILQQINDKFPDLKRRSFIEKMNLLKRRWGVDLSGIDESRIKNAKSARDQVVHKGKYVPRHAAVSEEMNLYEHILTVREVAVRFILTAIDFEGRYFSYIHGQEHCEFKKYSPELNFKLLFLEER